MWTNLGASFEEWWIAMPPGLQAMVFVAGGVFAIAAYAMFLGLLDLIFADVWGVKR